MSEGHYTGPIEVGSSDEIGDLARAFGSMVEELREKDRLVEYLRTGAATVPSGDGSESRGLLATGRLFAGRYEIQEELGAGGMGVVYRAFDREVGETAGAQGDSARRRAAGPHAARALQAGAAAGAADHSPQRGAHLRPGRGRRDLLHHHGAVRGTTVATLIQEAGRLAVPAALTIGKQVCRALEVAHEAGIVHRDIKPQNLLVDPTGFLKVTDFGIARLAGAQSEGGQALTVEGVVVGTPQYMAPEQLLGEPVDGRADLYATGAVLFECLTGRRVLESSDAMAVVAHHLVAEASTRIPRRSIRTFRRHSAGPSFGPLPEGRRIAGRPLRSSSTR